MSGEQTKAAEPLPGTHASVYLPEQSGTMIRSEGLVSLANQEITMPGVQLREIQQAACGCDRTLWQAVNVVYMTGREPALHTCHPRASRPVIQACTSGMKAIRMKEDPNRQADASTLSNQQALWRVAVLSVKSGLLVWAWDSGEV